ncbi:hypothetical protein [Desulfovibrio litoralis]|uniref:Uncharacterized protein n=1 Tax=Desulfovibrio litoralis DSM 11393 TaxID=1121455 RepID=A0A1M7S639_9BACT|nr:hypothetical protein [Desulfovibrio litoralis]SHN53812.1 hypothetical protein SAMN02745728_00458 [Desulfovibrio litoralis DSM 11393]
MMQESVNVEVCHSYDCSDLSDRFQLLLEGLDFHVLIDSLNISRWNIFKRNKAKTEFFALAVILWKLALEQSFPTIAEHCFESFTERLQSDMSQNKVILERIQVYNEILSHKKNNDFYEVATYLVDLFTLGDGDQKRYRLQVSLDIRKVYNIIFDRLI